MNASSQRLKLSKVPALDIKDKPTKAKSPTERLVTFDIIFEAIAPQNSEQIKIIVLNLGKKSTSHKLLKRTGEKILREEYEIEMTQDMRKAAEEALRKKNYVKGKYTHFNGDIELYSKASYERAESSCRLAK